MSELAKPSWWEIRWATDSDGYKYNGAINGPKGLVVHSTASPGYYADAIFNNFNRPNRGASIHGTIDHEKFIQMMPFTQKAGHIGSGKYGSFNTTHLGIEFCEPKGLVYNTTTWAVESYNPPAGYFEAIWDKGTTLYAYLCQQFGIDPLQHDANGGIVGHYEGYALGYGGNHGDPRGWFACEGKTMDDFRQAVYEKMNGLEDENMLTYEQFCDYMTRYETEKAALPGSSWSEADRRWANDNGIINGDGEGNMRWKSYMTREEYAATEHRQAGK